MRFWMVLVAVAVVSGTASARAGGPESEPVTGFRMEGDPKIETVFGDVEQYKRYVDRFYAAYGDMQKTREDFSRNVQAVLATLAADQARGPGKCPADAVALTYSRAFRLGQLYHKLGKDLEGNMVSVRELDGLGETAALTPDYRWKVARSVKIYPEMLKDFREMKVAFQAQLAAEVKFHGCDVGALVQKGEELDKAGAPPTAPMARPGIAMIKKKDADKLAPPIAASTATFFIDNASCPTALRVYVDAGLVGEVGSSAKAAFQAPVGRHELCLIPSTSQQQCGDPGTVRRTYIHDGWSITLRCD
jgi:hypothetical protein